MSAKCTEELKIRVSPELLLALSKLANAEDRSLSEYFRMVLSLHSFGHAHRLEEAPGRVKGAMVPHREHDKYGSLNDPLPHQPVT